MTVRPIHEQILEAVAEERRRIASRRGFLKTSAKLAGGGAVAMAVAGTTLTGGRRSALAQEFESDLDILNYALSLENLETSFYGKVIESGLFRGSQLELIKKFADNERQHRELLEATVEKLGGKPAAPVKTTFPLNSASGVLTLAATIENAGAAAYLGQANRIRDKEVLAAALSIHSVEARHAATLNGLVGLPPTPQGSFAAPLSMEEVLTTVQQFIVS